MFFNILIYAMRKYVHSQVILCQEQSVRERTPQSKEGDGPHGQLMSAQIHDWVAVV